MARAKALKILIVDDHPIVRAGVRRVLGNRFKAEFAEARNALEAIGCCIREAYDLILLDVSLPGRSGFDLLGDLKLRWPRTAVLMLSMNDSAQFVRRAQRTGADGYVSKATLEGELIHAVGEVLGGRAHFGNGSREEQTRTINTGSKPFDLESLSAREFEVFRMIIAGNRGMEIASHLAINSKTVSTYRARLLKKLGVRSTAELAQYATRVGLEE